jgi:hypothetical protein
VKKKDMDKFKNIIRTIIPEVILTFLLQKHRKFVFWYYLKKFMKNPEEMLNKEDVISKLTYGWGNEGWSAPNHYLMNVLKHAEFAKEPILECGSGLTTLLLGIISGRTKSTVWTLEHNKFWGSKIKALLNKHNIKTVNVFVKELSDYGDFFWYTPPLDLLPNNFGLVVCDGPPSDTKGGRYGLISIMKTKLSPGCIILLDDYEREAEQLIVKQWVNELSADFIKVGEHRPFAKITIPV